jgi:ribosomal protein L12E/L44/L45/RPP1/RPP2
VVAAVARLVRHGLPVTPANSDAVLLELRGVVARTVDPTDPGSRRAALDGVLRGLLARFPDARYAAAARALFGLPPALPGQNLTVRRDVAAAEAGHEAHHFRKRVEPRLVQQVAWQLLTDADQFTRTPMIAPRLAPASGRQPIPADPFSWEVAEQEEQLSRLWSALYAARAELLAVERLVSLRADEREIAAASRTAAWRWAGARAEAISCTTALASVRDVAVDELMALAGWCPALSAAQTSRLTEAAAGGASREQFSIALEQETDLRDAWVGGFLANHNQWNGSP